jgi:uncharacterized protein YcbK (DUF882 family)
MSKYKIQFLIAIVAIFPFAATVSKTDDRQLSFYHTHTAESLTVTYYRDGEYDASALNELNHFLRDFRTGDATEMNPGVLDSPATNEMLRGKSSGVARNSQHLQGNAIDVRLTDLDTAKLRDVALSLQRGGVGYYRESDFVHVDTGRVRQW